MRALILLLALAAAPAAAQDAAPNAPESCPYCGGDPEVMARAGVVSHGPFEFGGPGEDTASVDAFLVGRTYWIETAHHEIGLAIGPYRIPQKERDKIRAELERLAKVLPEVDPKTRTLDEWLRVHLFAQRCEDAYRRFLALVRREPGWFPAPDEPWMIGEPFRGIGPYLGQKGKYEVLLLESEAEHVAFLKEQFGLSIKRTQRWNAVERDTLSVTIHLRQGDLRIDEALHAHVVFNLAHLYFDGYKHYSYDTPIWLHEGLAHLLGREVSTRYNSFDATEGAIASKTREDEWIPEAQELARDDEAPRMAELIRLRSYAELDLRHHFTVWSKVDYLAREHPEGFACLLDALKGRTQPDGSPDGSRMPDVHREAFLDCLGLSYAAFDAAWKAWLDTQDERKD